MCFVRTDQLFATKIRHLLRYASVSAIATVTTLTILGILVGFVGFPALWANVIATAVGTVLSFELNRRSVWSERSRRPTVRQVVPFCSLAFAGLVLSSLAVRIAGGLTANSGWGLHTVAVEFANVGTYGALWVAQLILCDRWLFGRSRPGSPEPDRDGEAPRGAGDRHSASSYAKTS